MLGPAIYRKLLVAIDIVCALLILMELGVTVYALFTLPYSGAPGRWPPILTFLLYAMAPATFALIRIICRYAATNAGQIVAHYFGLIIKTIIFCFWILFAIYLLVRFTWHLP